MLKKLLILPILWSILWLGAFASADTVDWFTSNTPIYSESFVSDYFSVWIGSYDDNDYMTDDYKFYVCVSSSDYPYTITYNYDGSTYNVSSNNFCFPSSFDYGDESLSFSKEINWVYYQSASPITYSSSSDSSDSSLGIPEIPNSFTSGLTSLVNNFWGTIANWLPTIILVALGIYAIFALFRVVRNYARSSFRG